MNPIAGANPSWAPPRPRSRLKPVDRAGRLAFRGARAARPAPAVGGLPRAWSSPGLLQVLMLVMVHAGLGFLPRGSLLALCYALAAFAVALWMAWSRPQPQWALMAAAYLTGAEVFWRMSQAGVFHEFGKYSICLVLLVGMFRQQRMAAPGGALVYFCLLVPGILMTLFAFNWYTSRRLISENASGPLALLICSAYYRSVVITRAQLVTLLMGLGLPMIAVGMYAVRRIATSDIAWGTESNTAASGGFGPNQVSAMLGLGAVACFLILVLARPLWQRVVFGTLGLWMLAQAALTFSRTGIYLAVLSSAVAGLFLLRNPRTRLKFLVGAVAAGLIAFFIIHPALDRLTGGKLAERFSETQLSNRGDIAAVDLQIWREHWLLGTGIGQARFERVELGFGTTAAHTEYTRLLAEHGIMGVVALGLLIGLGAWNLIRSHEAGRAVVAGTLVWSFAFMMVSAMRLAAPSFLFGLSFANLKLDDKPAQVRRNIGRRPIHPRPAYA